MENKKVVFNFDLFIILAALGVGLVLISTNIKNVFIDKYDQLDQKLARIETKLTREMAKKKSKEIDKKIDKKKNKREKDNNEELILSNLIEYLQPKLDKNIRLTIAKVVLKECKKKGLDPLLILALIYEESNFRPLAQSKAGAVGLMQVRFATWKEHPILKDNGVSAKIKLFWIDKNIQCGTEILKKYINEAKGNIVVALNRYHTGSTKLEGKAYEIKYINKIMLRYYKLQQRWRVLTNETH